MTKTPEQFKAQYPVSEKLLGEYENRGATHRDVWFCHRFALPMICIFAQWEDAVYTNGSEEVRKYIEMIRGLSTQELIKNNLQYISPNVALFQSIATIQIKERLDEKITIKQVQLGQFQQTVKQLKGTFPDDFSAEMTLAEIAFTPEQIKDAYIAWSNAILDWKRWGVFHKYKEGIPFGLDLGRRVLAIPSAFNFKEIRLETYFNRYILPAGIVQREEFRRRFFEHLADDYEGVVNLKLKSKIFESMFGYLIKDNEKDMLLLDGGSGTGLAFTNKPEGSKITLIGVDEVKQMCRLAYGKGEPVTQASCGMLPFPKASFKAAMLPFLVTWNENPLQILKEMYRIIKPGGRLVFNVHKPHDNWQVDYHEVLLECGFKKVDLFEEVIEREERDEGEMHEEPYTAYYVVAE